MLYDLSDGVATVTLNRPDAMNALNTELKTALRDTLLAAADDAGGTRGAAHRQRPRVLRRAGPRRARAEPARATSTAVWATVPEHYTPIATTLATMPKPVVAAVNGVAAGAGAAFAFACDFRIVADTAGFNMAFSAVGLSADSGSSWTLPRLVGMAKAKELLLLPVDDPGGAGARARARHRGRRGRRGRRRGPASWPQRLAAGPTVAYGAIRRSLAFSAGHDIDESLDYRAADDGAHRLDRRPSRRREVVPGQGETEPFDGR